MGSELQIPIITPDDLRAFQVRHFSGSSEGHDSQEEHFDDGFDDEEDDGLGYYPDGVKRTLTDEQISMFRHSETYALIRERQVRKENQEADFEAQIVFKVNPAASLAPADEGMDGFVDGGDEDEEEYMRFLEAERRAEAKNQRNKRKATSREDFSHRRVARELDIAVADEQLLDYDEQPSKRPKDSDSNAKNGSRSKQHHESPGTALQERDVKPEGRKIWWPTIREGR